MKVKNGEEYRGEKERVDDSKYHQDRIRRLQARRQHGYDTAPDADHPNKADVSRRTTPNDSEYQRDVEYRHDNATEHSNQLN